MTTAVTGGRKVTDADLSGQALTGSSHLARDHWRRRRSRQVPVLVILTVIPQVQAAPTKAVLSSMVPHLTTTLPSGGDGSQLDEGVRSVPR